MQLTNIWLDISFATDSGTGNGSSTEFVTTYDLKTSNTIWITVNGLTRLLGIDYTIDLETNKVTFTTAPATAQKIIIRYMLKG